MAYNHNQRQVLLATGASTGSAATIATYTPGYQPIVLRAWALVFTTAVADTGIVLLEKRPIPGSASGVATVDTINVSVAAGAAGRVLYHDGLHIKCSPGEQLAVTVSATAGSGVCEVVALIEESWDVPQNNTEMTETL